jgi:type IV pilus assembly protein PilX
MTMQYKRNQSMSFATHQKGAVLIVSLMLMLVMTLLSIASMSTSVMQEKMAANAQNTNRTFQAAESAIDTQVSIILGGDSANLNKAMVAASGIGDQILVTIGGSEATATAQIEYLGEIITSSGSSIDADESSTALTGHRFALVGTGSIAAVQAETQITQGIEYH